MPASDFDTLMLTGSVERAKPLAAVDIYAI
jgi:hypothetical protein